MKTSESSQENAPMCIAVDWGTSNLRAFLMDFNGNVFDQRSNDRGMLTLESEQFEHVLIDLLDDWVEPDVPIFMAGMVGSRSGWQEVPYLPCPIHLDSLNSHLYWVQTRLLKCDVAIVPGLKGFGVSGHHDVMRGEETQLLGALHWLRENNEINTNVLCCLPGTHSKWVPLYNDKVEQFSTSFSGELFARLSSESSLVKGVPISKEFNIDAFKKGLVTSQQAGGFLHHLFSVRSDYMCGALTAEEVRDYLSGVVIGHDVAELATLHKRNIDKVLVIGSSHLILCYQEALAFHQITSQCLDAREASIRGLAYLAKSHFNNSQLDMSSGDDTNDSI